MASLLPLIDHAKPSAGRVTPQSSARHGHNAPSSAASFATSSIVSSGISSTSSTSSTSSAFNNTPSSFGISAPAYFSSIDHQEATPFLVTETEVAQAAAKLKGEVTPPHGNGSYISKGDGSRTGALTQADTDQICDRRRPEEEDTTRRLNMSSQLMGKTVIPFLKDHIPGLYSPLAKLDTIESMQKQNNDPNSRYCYRHRPDSKCRRAADESKMVKIQSELENLKPDDQQAITHVWSLFSAAPAKQRDLMLQGIMTQCCFPQLSRVSREVADQLKIDFITALPPEVAYKILCYLDPLSLCKASLVSRQWRALADDDQVWYRMCEQHIDRKCTKCGFGLPLLERKRLRDWTRMQRLSKSQLGQSTKPRIPALPPVLPAPNTPKDRVVSTKRRSGDVDQELQSKRRCRTAVSEQDDDKSVNSVEHKPRAWKEVYRDRFRVGYNWRNGKCAIKVFRGHHNGVTCLQIDDTMMATGSYDATIRIWNLETGEQLRVLRGHTQGIRSLQFDDKILVSGSLDGTIKIWNWSTGELLSTLACHQGGVISVNLDGEWLASGSTDKTIKVFNLKTKESFTLKGHEDWVNQVRIDGTVSRTLFSASDDCKVKLWDLDTKQCIRTFEGHVGHVQQILTLPADFEPDEDPAVNDATDSTSVTSGRSETPLIPATNAFGGCHIASPTLYENPRAAYGPSFMDDPNRALPCRYILSSALDSTIKCWDTATGRCVRTFFGHLEGVWALVGDTLRVVSGANDTMVKVWEPRSGKCERTWTGHRGPVTCVGLSDSRLASGSEDGEVRLYSFQDKNGLDDCGTPS